MNGVLLYTSLPSSRKIFLFPQLVNWAPTINKTLADTILGFSLAILILKFLTLTKVINDEFYLVCVNNFLPSKVSTHITPEPRDQHDRKLSVHTVHREEAGCWKNSMSSLVR